MLLLRRIVLAIDSGLETFALTSLLSMIMIVSVQVFTRKVFNFVFFWSEEITLLLLVWFAFMGIGIGVREHLHMAMDLIEGFTPKWFIKILDKLIELSTFIFGVYLIYYGWEFTVIMNESTLAATKLPNSALYIVMPITGVMICAYSLLQFCGVDTTRHDYLKEGIHDD